MRSFAREVVPGVYSFPMLRPEFCRMVRKGSPPPPPPPVFCERRPVPCVRHRPPLPTQLSEEVDALAESDAVKVRPNSMNQYGVVLNLVGLAPALDRLLSAWLRPFARVLFPDHGGASLDEHHSFVVEVRTRAFPGGGARGHTPPSPAPPSTRRARTCRWTRT